MKDIILKIAAGEVPNEVSGKNGDGGDLVVVISNILSAIIGVLGIVCVAFVILGGITYMTSSGDAGKVKKGRDTILYGVIGLIICVLAFAIVNFVIRNIASA